MSEQPKRRQEPEAVEATLRRYGVPEDLIGACCADLAQHMPTRSVVREEYGVETRWGMEWGASVGMSHRYEYTAENVFGLANGRPVYRRTRTTYPDRISEPELVERPTRP